AGRSAAVSGAVTVGAAASMAIGSEVGATGGDLNRSSAQATAAAPANNSTNTIPSNQTRARCGGMAWRRLEGTQRPGPRVGGMGPWPGGDALSTARALL